MGGCIEDEDSGGYNKDEAESSYNLIHIFFIDLIQIVINIHRY